MKPLPVCIRINLCYPSNMDLDPIDPVTSGADIPHWLQSPQQPTPDDPRSGNASRLVRASYPNLFENALEQIMSGKSLATIVANDQRGIQLGRFLYWINADPTRRRQYERACEVAAENLAHSLVSIADAEDNPMEDVQRTAQRIKARTYLMEKWSPARYGDSKHIRIDQTSLNATVSPEDLRRMSLADLKRMAYEKVIEGSAHPVDPTTVDLEDAA